MSRIFIDIIRCPSPFFLLLYVCAACLLVFAYFFPPSPPCCVCCDEGISLMLDYGLEPLALNPLE